MQIRNGFPMTTQLSVDTDWQVRRIVSMSSSRVDELAEDVASAVRAEVEFYKSARGDRRRPVLGAAPFFLLTPGPDTLRLLDPAQIEGLMAGRAKTAAVRRASAAPPPTAGRP